MTEAHVQAKKRKYLSEEKKEKVKRRLFCDEKLKEEDSPCTSRSTTPLSYEKKDTRIIFFVGCKKPDDKHYFCQVCFDNKYNIDTFEDSEFLYVGEREYSISFKPTFDEHCCVCWKKLYRVIYPRETARF